MKKGVAWILTNKEGEVLLQKRTANYEKFPSMWTIMGGAMEEGETPKEAINRELKEELGIKLDLKFCDEFILHTKVDYTYLFKGKLDNLVKISLGEGNGIAFFSKEELKDIKCPDKAIIRKWM